MEPAQKLYDQAVTHLRLRLFLRPTSEMPGPLFVELASIFLDDVLLPGSVITSLDTKRAGTGAKVNMGEFSERRWSAAVKKVLAGAYAVLGLTAHTPDFPNQKIWLYLHANPPGGKEFLGAGTIEILCGVSYLRHLAASPERVGALLRFGTTAWNGIEGGAAYGFANIAITPHRRMFADIVRTSETPAGPFPWVPIKVPTERAHAIPVAYVGNDVDGNLERHYVQDRGIKGAFWANFLNATHVRLAGGAPHLRAQLADMRVESLTADGLLIVATDSPLPEDSEENRERFLRLHSALQPSFLSRADTPRNMTDYLGYFYREKSEQS